MNKYTLISFVVGGICGSIASYFYLKNKYNKELDKMFDELYNNIDSEFEKDGEDNEDSEDEEKDGKENNEDEDKDSENDDEIIEGRTFSYTNEPPIIIDETEYGEDTGYACVTLEYYINNDILIDDTDRSSPIEDVIKAIGEGMYNTLKESKDGDIYYVKNDNYMIYYEIITLEEDYEY